MSSLSLLYILLLLLVPLGGCTDVTRDEANIAGVLYNEPFIVAEFLISNTHQKALLLINELREEETRDVSDHVNNNLTTEHLHALVTDFCHERTRQCTSREYYLILDKLILMFSDLYENRLRDLTEVLLRVDDSIGQSEDAGHPSETRSRPWVKCRVKELHDTPSPEEFYEYVKSSQPFIIRSASKQQREASSTQSTTAEPTATSNEVMAEMKKKKKREKEREKEREEEDLLWSLQNLARIFGNSTVIVNASPTSDFDGVSYVCLM
jgi:hypothetical protein